MDAEGARDARDLATVSRKLDTVFHETHEQRREQSVYSSKNSCGGARLFAAAELRTKQCGMVVDAREHEFMDAGARQVAKIGRVVRTCGAVAQDWNSGKPLHERGERRPYRLVLSISRFGQQARDRTSVLRYRRVKLSDAVNDVHGRWAKGRRQAHAHDAIADQRYDCRGAHLPRLPLV